MKHLIIRLFLVALLGVVVIGSTGCNKQESKKPAAEEPAK